MQLENGRHEKQPWEEYDYPISYASRLAAFGDNDTLDSATVNIAPDGLTITDQGKTADAFVVWLGGGTHGASYTVTIRAITVEGRRMEDEFTLKVREKT